ncbi:5'/3'-nucleotidase SurE, partial [Myxococcota bacterium]|nr:5'/3'-nucleotidase SurE [Myxococcota bacterium]
DCTYMGLFEVLKVPPDLVISGINDGYNLGTDVFYSGTFAGAFEGALRGLPALALSTNRGAPEEILVAVSRAAITVAIRMLEIPLAAGTVLNMNHPDVLVPQGIRMTSLGKRVYLDDVEKRLDPRGVPYYWIGGSPSFGFDNLVGGERGALIENFISLTPVNQVNISHPEEYAHFENLNGKVAR